MATFQTIVMLTATIILVLSLCAVGIALYNQKYRSDYPPVIANCPDYWMDASGNNGKGCNSEGQPSAIVGKCGTSMDFSTANWSGQSGLCNKAKWARQCNLSWDGITNNDSICSS